jgi:hypothetical protein
LSTLLSLSWGATTKKKKKLLVGHWEMDEACSQQQQEDGLLTKVSWASGTGIWVSPIWKIVFPWNHVLRTCLAQLGVDVAEAGHALLLRAIDNVWWVEGDFAEASRQYSGHIGEAATTLGWRHRIVVDEKRQTNLELVDGALAVEDRAILQRNHWSVGKWACGY